MTLQKLKHLGGQAVKKTLNGSFPPFEPFNVSKKPLISTI